MNGGRGVFWKIYSMPQIVLLFYAFKLLCKHNISTNFDADFYFSGLVSSSAVEHPNSQKGALGSSEVVVNKVPVLVLRCRVV